MTDSDSGDILRGPTTASNDELEQLELVSAPAELWRIHWERDLTHPKQYQRGKYRFDAPEGEYAVTYANSARNGAVAEVYGDLGRIKSEEAARQLSMVTTTRPLRLLRLDSSSNQKLLKLDGRICDSKQYLVTQEWSAFFHRRTDIDGLCYRSRHAEETENVCLFLDRCCDDLVVHLEGTLLSLRRAVLEIADRYDISVYLPRTKGWS